MPFFCDFLSLFYKKCSKSPVLCNYMHVYNDVAMQAVAVGFIIGVVQDSVETALNSSGDVFFTATAEEFDRKKKGEKQFTNVKIFF